MTDSNVVTQQGIEQALAQHSLAEIASNVRTYRSAVLGPAPNIPRLADARDRLGLSPTDIATDLAAAETVAALQRDIDAVAAQRDAARPVATIAAAREAAGREASEASRPFVEKMRALDAERQARADLDTCADDLKAALSAVRRKSPRLFADDLGVAAQATPRGAEVRAWAGRNLGAGRSVATQAGE